MAAPDRIPSIVTYLKGRLAEANVGVPDVGIICGSGLGVLASSISNPFVIKYEEIKGFPQSTVAGHAGELVFGTLGGKNVVAMKGRFHYYEGYTPAQVAMPVRVLASLGIKVLLVSNAAGGCNPDYKVGDVMVIKGVISASGLAGLHPLVGRNDDRFGTRFPAVSPAFDAELMDLVSATAERIQTPLTIRRGVYFGVSGPSYETPHEIALIRTLHGDAVGMSTVFEVLAAAHAGIKVLGFSLITNRCMGPDEKVPAPSHEEVLDAVKSAESALVSLVTEVVGSVDVDQYPRSKAFDFFAAAPAAEPEAPVPAPAGEAKVADADELSQRLASLEGQVKDMQDRQKRRSKILIAVVGAKLAVLSGLYLYKFLAGCKTGGAKKGGCCASKSA